MKSMGIDGLEEIGKVVDSYEEADYLYGGENYFITDKDIELLKQGKIINFSCNDEYGNTLRYLKDLHIERGDQLCF